MIDTCPGQSSGPPLVAERATRARSHEAGSKRNEDSAYGAFALPPGNPHDL